jgi:hypothetical protein
MENKIPFHVEEVTKSNKTKWACQTINILDCQHLRWNLLPQTDTPLCINAFNYGDGVEFSTYFGKNMVCVQPIDGESLVSEIVLYKGSIKYIHHETMDGLVLTETRGDLLLMLSAIINLHLNKHTGYIQVQSIGKHVISIIFHISEERYNKHDEEWRRKLINVYSCLGWKL